MIYISVSVGNKRPKLNITSNFASLSKQLTSRRTKVFLFVLCFEYFFFCCAQPFGTLHLFFEVSHNSQNKQKNGITLNN